MYFRSTQHQHISQFYKIHFSGFCQLTKLILSYRIVSYCIVSYPILSYRTVSYLILSWITSLVLHTTLELSDPVTL